MIQFWLKLANIRQKCLTGRRLNAIVFSPMSNKFVIAVFAAFLLATPSLVAAAPTPKSDTVFLASAAVVKKPVVAKKVVATKKPVKKPVVKKVVKKSVKAATCVRCKSLAEGADNSKASKAAVWSGTVIGINAGSHDVIITEATALNRIKGFAQRNVNVDANTKIIMKDGDEKSFNDMDIGYRIEVRGAYNTKLRTIKASSVTIIKVPDAPITKTK